MLIIQGMTIIIIDAIIVFGFLLNHDSMINITLKE
jgi:hypothetical protein